MFHRHSLVYAIAVGVAAVVVPPAAVAQPPSSPTVTVLNSTALGGMGAGSTIGPDGALYAPNSFDGTLVRIDPDTGADRVVGTGLPLPNGGFGAWDVAFLRDTAYVLVTLAGSDIGQSAVMGIYRLDQNGTFSVFADVGSWAAAHPPVDPDYFLSQGVQYSMEVWRDGFLVTDAHLAKVYRVDEQGNVEDLVAFDSTDAVPLGLEVAHGKVYLSTAGPIPHLPSTSKVNEIGRDGTVEVVGEWSPGYTGNRGLLIDVESGLRGRLYGLLQGHWDLDPNPDNEGFPAAPNTGEIVVVDHGEFRTLVAHLNQPTSLEFSGRSAFVVTLDGTVLRIDGI